MSWLLLNSVFSKIFSGLWDVCFGHYLATKNLNVAFCLLFLVLPNFRHAQKAKFHVTELSIFTLYFPVSCYILFLFPPPPFFFSWAFTMLHFGRKSFHENQENCEIISQFTIYYLKGGRDGVEWSKTLIGIFCSTMHVFFFGILLHLFNWIVLICVYMSMERWLIHKLGGKVVYDH